MTGFDVPHLAFPLRLDADGGLAQVEQDSAEDVSQCIAVLLQTPAGARPLAPDVGVDDPTFSTGIDPDELRQTLEAQEDRAALTVTTGPVDESGEQQIRVEVALAGDTDARLDPDVS